MILGTNADTMEIEAVYNSKGEFRKLAMQKRMRLAMKALEKAGQCEIKIDEDKRTIYIKCYHRAVYENILKGFQSVAHMR